MFIEPFETSRLIIREFDTSDFVPVHEYASSDAVTKYMLFEPSNEEQTLNFLNESIELQSQDPRNDYDFAIVLKKDDVLIGGGGVHITNPSVKEGFIGYCLNDRFWGNGYATEAANAFIRFGFERLNLHRIFATCHTDNIGSIKVLEKTGMKKEGRLRNNRIKQGKWHDSFIFSILRHEYEPQS